jgi:hypothetical protein
VSSTIAGAVRVFRPPVRDRRNPGHLESYVWRSRPTDAKCFASAPRIPSTMSATTASRRSFINLLLARSGAVIACRPCNKTRHWNFFGKILYRRIDHTAAVWSAAVPHRFRAAFASTTAVRYAFDIPRNDRRFIELHLLRRLSRQLGIFATRLLIRFDALTPGKTNNEY